MLNSDQVLSVANLTARRRSGALIRDISLDIRAGEIVALIGENGVGKSTVGRAIAGLAPITDGAIALVSSTGVRRLERMAAWRLYRQGIFYVPAERPVFEALTVAENLGLVEAVLERDPAETPFSSIMQKFPALEGKLQQQANTLSGGEKRLLALARAVFAVSTVVRTSSSARKSVVLILDEPTQGLAPAAVANVTEIVRHMRHANLMILVIEQNLAFTRTVADRGYLMMSGQIVGAGEITELTRQRRALEEVGPTG